MLDIEADVHGSIPRMSLQFQTGSRTGLTLLILRSNSVEAKRRSTLTFYTYMHIYIYIYVHVYIIIYLKIHILGLLYILYESIFIQYLYNHKRCSES